MSSNEALIALACITVAIAVGMQLWRSVRRGAVRRARRKHYREAGYASRPQHLADESQAQLAAMTPDRAHAIRREAEQSARRAVSSLRAEPANPYPRGTQEFVLWVATYHLTMTELDEAAAEARAGAVSEHA
jgi:hypothetical protein